MTMRTIDTHSIFDELYYLADEASLIGPSRHAAALVIKNKIICTGVAQMKTHPIMKRFSKSEKKITIHAEIDAILKGIKILGEDLSACSLYVLRLSRGNNVSMSKPCPICQKAIEAFGITQVYWSS